MRPIPCVLAATVLLAACGDDPAPVRATPDVGTDADAAPTDVVPEIVETQILVPQFGGESPEIRGFAGPNDGLQTPLDLEFDPESPENLWVSSQDNDGIVILFDAGTPEQRTELFLDAFRDHFLESVSSIAFGAASTWASCQESRNTYNGLAPPDDFMGPALWPSDLDVFAAVFQNPFGTDLGSHLDMLHASPNCMGIAHYRANEYFVFDGSNGHMVYYDFVQDHGPGQHDHSDGIIRRYPEIELTRIPGVPGHMEYHDESNRVFIADTGAGRVLAYTVGTGTESRTLAEFNEPLAEYSEHTGADYVTFVDGLQQPSGLAIHDDRLFVGDHATGLIHAYDIETGALIESLDTGADDLAGIEIAPDGALWFIDAAYSEVLRVTPAIAP